MRAVLPAAFTIALLGAIEALLCAVVCDSMTGTKHHSDKELVAQGVVNTILPFFGGIPATAAIARSAVNIREGAKTRVAGIIHGLFILLTLLMFAPVAQYIPKAFLAGVLMFVSFRMINIHEFRTIMHISRSETLVLFLTFALTVLTDLVFAVQVGMAFAVFLVFIKLTNIINISTQEDYYPSGRINLLIDSYPYLKEKVAVYTIHGPFFFGAMNVFDRKITEHIDLKKQILIIRMKHVDFIDSTAIVRLNDILKERKKHGSEVFLSGLRPDVKTRLMNNEEFKELITKDHIFERTTHIFEYIKKRQEKNNKPLNKKAQK